VRSPAVAFAPQDFAQTAGRLADRCERPRGDLARFAANLVSGRDGDLAHARSVLDAMVSSYGTPPGLEWHFAAALLRRCDRPFRRLKKRWPGKAVAILDAAEEAVSTL
jgi:hypothetical protein